MGSIDGLKEQVEELKQRLNNPSAQLGADAAELKTRLASIKSSLEGKQQEIAKLTAEKQRLAAEAQRAAAENEQLRKMLGEVMAVIDGRPSEGPAKLLSDFLAETDALVKPVGNGVKETPPAGQAADQAASAGRAVPAQAGQQPQGAQGDQGAQGAGGSKPDSDVAIQLGSDVREESAEEEESPALRRILKRGRRAG